MWACTMNDFTKDELILLGACVFSKYIDSLRDPTIEHLIDDLRKLGKKIQSMIKNFERKQSLADLHKNE